MKKAAIGVSLLLAMLISTVSAAMSLTSTDIRSGAVIPAVHIYPRCGGENISPALSWSGAPDGTKSFVLTMIDVDVTPAHWSHWIVVNLPATLSSLPRGVMSLPGNAKAVVSNFGDAGYAGPCPPKGTGVHHYEFTIWALPTAEISLANDEKATTLTELLAKRAISRASFVGLVSAPSS
jgi:Raf kinase inhibitor-like YbhB/YbcL family protein